MDGYERQAVSKRIRPASGDDIIGYLVAHGSGFDNYDLYIVCPGIAPITGAGQNADGS